MNKFLADILRDKGSTKFGITKFLALLTFIFMILYLGIYSFIFQKEVDHTIFLELLGFLITLLGLKNNWGMKDKPSESQPAKNMLLETKVDKHSDDEGSF